MIDIEKFICSLMQFTPVSKEVKYLINCTLKDQGLEYKDGKIVKIEPKEELSEFERGYKQAIEDAVRYMDKVWGLNIFGNSINDFRETMEQKLKELSQG